MEVNKIYCELMDEIADVLPEISKDDLDGRMDLRDVGANSVDRMDIIIGTMEKMGINIPLVKFGEAHTINDIVNILYERKE